jgi:hypothetical protein
MLIFALCRLHIYKEKNSDEHQFFYWHSYNIFFLIQF